MLNFVSSRTFIRVLCHLMGPNSSQIGSLVWCLSVVYVSSLFCICCGWWCWSLCSPLDGCIGFGYCQFWREYQWFHYLQCRSVENCLLLITYVCDSTCWSGLSQREIWLSFAWLTLITCAFPQWIFSPGWCDLASRIFNVSCICFCVWDMRAILSV